MKYIAYYRVSTKKQGESGLGLEAQQTAVQTFVDQQSRATLECGYIEVETGKRSDRDELSKALAHCRRSKTTLVVAKLDRLARNVAFTSALMESNVDFVCCDNPHANRLTIHILAAVAEDETRRISDRTKAALGAAKARGVKLGSARPGHWAGREQARLKGLEIARQRSIESRKQAAKEAYTDLIPFLRKLRQEGCSYQKIADRLNRIGHTTRRGKAWSPMQVSNVLKRCQKPTL